jgi:uncharacterized protein (DUF885 family)
MTVPPPSADPVFALSDAFVEDFARSSPIQASLAGVPGVFDGWDDFSPNGAAASQALFSEYQRKLAALPPATERWGKVARRVMADFLAERSAYHEHLDNLCDLNNIESTPQHLRVVFDVMDTSTREGWQAASTRLATIDRVLRSYRAALDDGARRGVVAAKRQVRAVMQQAKVHASDRSSFHTLLSTFEASPHADPTIAEELKRGIEHARTSFTAFGSFLEQYEGSATDRDAFGAERYARSAQRFLGMDIDPRETYAWGFREIASIEASMQALADRIEPGSSARQVIDRLRNSPDQLVVDPERFLHLMRERQERALSELTVSHFEVPAPIRRLDVKLAPTGSALGAYYIPPGDGFKRPGTVYYAPAEGQPFTLFSEITTAYHEGFPGHHLQCGLQVYLADRLSRLHRLLVVWSGYAEGWALYAEQLMDELGYLDRPEYVMGMYMAKLFRACRVVADIGMHLDYPIPLDQPLAVPFHPGAPWSYELCVELLNDRAFIPRDFAESEATRYLGWPGQAISYKVGERVILDLREEAKQSLGARFDLRSFHEAVLTSGSVGLDHLREIVRESLGYSA